MAAEFRRKPVSFQKVPDARHLILYFQCRAFDAGAPEECRGLEGMGSMSGPDGPRQPLEFLCAQAYQESRIAWAAIRGDPGAAALCADLPPQPEIRDMKAACGLLQRFAGDPAALAAGLPAVLRNPGDAAQLRQTEIALRRTLGDDWACGQIDPASPARAICGEYAAFRRARKLGRPDACGDKGLCRRMMGERSPGCDTMLPRLQEIYCRLWVDRKLMSPPEKPPSPP